MNNGEYTGTIVVEFLIQKNWGSLLTIFPGLFGPTPGYFVYRRSYSVSYEPVKCIVVSMVQTLFLHTVNLLIK
jgi:hypothetical protein